MFRVAANYRRIGVVVFEFDLNPPQPVNVRRNPWLGSTALEDTRKPPCVHALAALPGRAVACGKLVSSSWHPEAIVCPTASLTILF